MSETSNTKKGRIERVRRLNFELDPNALQRRYFEVCCRATREIFNFGCEINEQRYAKKEKFLGAFDMKKKVKSELSWIKGQVSERVLEGACEKMALAFKNFFRRCKEGSKEKGYPRRKYHGKCRDSFWNYVPYVDNRHIRINLGSNISRELSLVRIKETLGSKVRRLPKGSGHSVTVYRHGDRWFASFVVKDLIEIPIPAEEKPIVGIDLGLKTYVTLSDGRTFLPPKPLVTAEKRLRRLSRALSRKKKGSHNAKKAAIRLGRLHVKISNQRKDFQDKLSTKLVRENKGLALETLNVSGMVKNHRLARSISDSGWSAFVKMLEYKGIWSGVEIRKADPFFPSSQLCSTCGVQNSALKDLGIREWTCSECGSVHDRDVNAATNLLFETYPECRGKGLLKESNACAVEDTPVRNLKAGSCEDCESDPSSRPETLLAKSVPSQAIHKPPEEHVNLR